MTLPDPRQLTRTGQQPRCVTCHNRHRPDLPCWRGKHRNTTTAMVLAVSQTCWICRGTATEADHVIARSWGGDDQLANLRPACRSCNAGKGADENPFHPEDPTPRAGVPLSPRWRRSNTETDTDNDRT